MRDNISQDQIAFYQQNGFLAIEGFLDRSELEQWRTVTDEAVAQRLESIGWKGQDDNYYSNVFLQCIRLADSHPGMAKLIYDERLGRVAATLEGVDGVRIWHDQALIKAPWGNPTAWHLDDPYWSFSSRHAISIWVALDDATLKNGCMHYLPGTHKMARFDNSGIGDNMAGLFKVYPEWKNIEPAAAPCPAGTAVFHNGLTAHGAGANMTPRPRRAMTCGYMPDGSTFNGTRNILPESMFNSLKIGDVLNDPKQNPLIWSKKGRG